MPQIFPRFAGLTLLFITLLVAGSSQLFAAHVLEDGYVERTVEVVIRDDIAYVEYSIGLNDVTMAQLLRDSDAAKNWKLLVRKTIRLTNNKSKGETQIEDPSKENLAEKKSKTEPVDEPVNPAKSNSNEKDATEAEATSAPLTQEDLLNFEKINLNWFSEAAPAIITKGLKITCDGQPVKVESLTLDPAPRHPFDVKVKFQFKIPKSDAESIELKVIDSNFLKQTGAVRYALKAKGKAVLLRSNVAPIIVRAQRVEIAGLTEEERKKQTSIEARIAILRTK